MYGLKKFRFIYLILLAVVAYCFFPVQLEAQEYKIGVSRQYYTGTNDYIVGTGSQTYAQEYFTGIGYCTGYYYLNHKKINNTQDPISQARQVLWYDTSSTNMFLSYLNFKLSAGSAQWHDGNITGTGTYNGKDIYIYNLSPIDQNSVKIPYTYTIGRFGIINKTSIDTIHITGHYITTPAEDQSTYLNHTNNTDFYNDADTDYSFSIIYYAQPCVPDMPISSNNIQLINGDADGNNRLSRVPAFHDKSAQSNAGRPITLGTTQLYNTGFFVPGNRNVSSFNNHITFDNGIFISAIKEPDISSYPNMSFPQRYLYDSGSAKYSGFDLLDSSFVYSADNSLSNQWGINPDTIGVTVSFVGVDKTNFGDSGQFCAVLITGSNLGLSGLGQLSWNRNELGYSVNIDSNTIRTLSKQQCSVFSAIQTGNIDIKRETVASVSWDAYDYSNSIVISQEYNTVSFSTPNRITGTTGYNFNNWSDNPILSMSTDSILLNNGNIVYNIPINNSQLKFTGTDIYAGINSNTFLIVVTGYESNILKSNSWTTSGTPDYNYVFSGNDITKFEFNLENERYDYTGFVDFINNGTVYTGMHFTVRFEATDFVGNKTTQNYIFRTPTWPNAPKSDGNLTKTFQTRQAIEIINIIDNIKDIDAVDGGGSQYNYSTYYPSHKALIADLGYISGAQALTSTQSLVLTSTNGNMLGATEVTMTGLIFVYDGSGSYITGTPYVSSGGEAMNDYIATNFMFNILATNIYGITGIIEYTINVAPSCIESPGCTDPVYVFWGTNLLEAQAQRAAALASGTDYLKDNHWYPHWFAEIKQTGPNFYFTGVDGESTSTVLYCASTGNDLLINYGGYSGPQSNILSVSSQTLTGDSLSVIGGDVFLFDVFTASVSANYVTVPDNGNQKMTIYVNRPLTGKVFYSVCEFTGTILDSFGCPVSGNYTGDVNWTRLTSSDQFVMTGWIEGGRLTGDRNGYVTGGSVNNGDQFDFWYTGSVLNGGGTRKYVRAITGDLDQEINTSGSVLFEITNRTGLIVSVPHEVYWIDNISPELTGYISSISPNQSATLSLSGYNTGVISTSFESDLIGDDEYVVTKFSGNIEPSIFENGYGSTTHTGQWYIDGSGSEYKMIHNITFSQDREGQICVEDRAGNESCVDIVVSGIGLHKDLVIVVRQAFRPEPTQSITGYAITSGDFWFWVKSGTEWTQNYNSAKNSGTNPKITTNSYGTGLVSIMTPASGAEYLVVFKGPGTLSAGFTGIWSDAITELNFFTGSYADQLSSDYVYKYNNLGTIENYLKVGDISLNGTGDYDYVISADFALINYNLTIGNNIIPYVWYDFDLNNVISSMEQSMVLQARHNRGFIGWLDFEDIISMTGFVNM